MILIFSPGLIARQVLQSSSKTNTCVPAIIRWEINVYSHDDDWIWSFGTGKFFVVFLVCKWPICQRAGAKRLSCSIKSFSVPLFFDLASCDGDQPQTANPIKKMFRETTGGGPSAGSKSGKQEPITQWCPVAHKKETKFIRGIRELTQTLHGRHTKDAPEKSVSAKRVPREDWLFLQTQSFGDCFSFTLASFCAHSVHDPWNNILKDVMQNSSAGLFWKTHSCGAGEKRRNISWCSIEVSKLPVIVMQNTLQMKFVRAKQGVNDLCQGVCRVYKTYRVHRNVVLPTNGGSESNSAGRVSHVARRSDRALQVNCVLLKHWNKRAWARKGRLVDENGRGPLHSPVFGRSGTNLCVTAWCGVTWVLLTYWSCARCQTSLLKMLWGSSPKEKYLTTACTTRGSLLETLPLCFFCEFTLDVLSQKWQ